jgi:hypothetical protein
LKNKKSPSILGGRVYPLKEIPDSAENYTIFKRYCCVVRNFSNTSLRKCLERMRPFEFRYENEFKVFWVTLKVIQLMFPALKGLCYILLRNGWSPKFQLRYQEILDFASESKRFRSRTFDFRSIKDTEELNILRILMDTDIEIWIPSTVFPRFFFRKESKLEYSFMDLDIEDKLLTFRQKVKRYLRSLRLKGLFIPPPDTLPKAGSSLYNDGGIARRDYELPQRSLTSGFKLQVFNPKPMQTREVWLPDKVTKISNLFWMIVGRQLLLKEPAFPDDDPLVTHERIKDKLGRFGYFDVSAFGLQYPRQYLVIIAEEIANLYGNPDLQEQVVILKNLFRRVSLQLEDGKFVYPTRGTGLGYYEDLKTIGVLAILSSFNPISVYGDQGLLRDETADIAVETLRSYGFIIKRDKFEHKQTVVKWSGWQMTKSSATRPKLYLEPLISIFSGEFHWERKNMIRSYADQYPELKYKISKFIPFQYELTFGWEFIKTDSLWSLENGGCSPLYPFSGGESRTYKVQRLTTPRDSITDNLLYTSPFFVEWKRSDAKEFSIRRKALYRSTRLSSSEQFEYSNPRIKLLKTTKPKFDISQKCISDWYDLRLIVRHGFSLGKVTYNLFGDDLYKAVIQCARAPNPFEAFVTGGYKVLTAWRAPPVVSSELWGLCDYLSSNVSLIKNHLTSKLDLDEFIHSESINKVKKRSLSNRSARIVESTLSQNWRAESPFKRIKLTSNMFTMTLPNHRDDNIRLATDIVGDLTSRGLPQEELLCFDEGEEDILALTTELEDDGELVSPV